MPWIYGSVSGSPLYEVNLISWTNSPYIRKFLECIYFDKIIIETFFEKNIPKGIKITRRKDELNKYTSSLIILNEYSFRCNCNSSEVHESRFILLLHCINMNNKEILILFLYSYPPKNTLKIEIAHNCKVEKMSNLNVWVNGTDINDWNI